MRNTRDNSICIFIEIARIKLCTNMIYCCTRGEKANWPRRHRQESENYADTRWNTDGVCHCGQRDNFRLLLLLRLLLVFRAGRLRSGTPKNRGKNCIRKGIVTQCHTRPHVHAHKRTLVLALALALTGSTRERESEKEWGSAQCCHPSTIRLRYIPWYIFAAGRVKNILNARAKTLLHYLRLRMTNS